MDRAGQHRGAVPPDLIAEVLAGDADGTRASRTQSSVSSRNLQTIFRCEMLRGAPRARDARHPCSNSYRAVDLDRDTTTPTTLVWDCDGELCDEDLSDLLERLLSEDANR